MSEIKILHCGDIHIRNLKYHDVYKQQFEKFYKLAKKLKPTYITVVGDLFDNFVDISNEANDLAGEFLTNLADIAKVIIVQGNHDLQKTNKTRLNSVETLVNLLKNPNITHFKTSGFYEDGNITWVNYSHLEKNVDPWDDSNITIPKNIKDKITIGLFHDPIYGSSSDTGMVFNSELNKPITYFKNNDFLLASDIHKHQFLRIDKSAFYSSSLIQQNHGETTHTHGFVELTIRDKKDFDVKFHDLPNPNNFVTLVVPVDFDYDNITLDDDYLTPKSALRYLWTDYSSAHTFENEQKLKKYAKDTWSLDKVIIKKMGVDTEMLKLETINESVNVLDLNEQRKIFIEYLKINKFSKEVIDKVLSIDDIINERIEININNGISFNINNIDIYNFKSYDKETIDFKGLGTNKIIQIHGINQVGKSTLFDAICYVLFNKTFGTLKKEKNGDQRYLNNKREIDECWVSIVLDINGEEYFIKRRTVRKWNRDHSEVTSCPTTLFYCKGDYENEETNLSDEQKKDTQQLIEETLGNFEDFVNKSFINGENLNALISMDRSLFIDGLIRDAGLEIFEDKMNQFKLHKTEILETRKTINIEEIESTFRTIEEDTEITNGELVILEDKLSELGKDKKIILLEKENKLTKLDKIDPDIESLDLIDIDLSIETENSKIEKNNDRLVLIEKLKKDVSEYDSSLLNTKQVEYDSKVQEINDIKLEVSLIDNNILTKKNEISQINNDINNIVNKHINSLKSEIQDFNLDISKIKEGFVEYINEYTNDINKQLSVIISEQTKINSDIESWTNVGKKLKKENEDIEGSSVCVMCHRALDGVDMTHIHKVIDDNKSEMDILKNKILDIKPKVKDLDTEHSKLKDIISNLKSRNYTFDDDVLKKYEDIKLEINSYKEKITTNTSKIDLINSDNKPVELEKELNVFNSKISDIEKTIKDLDFKKDLKVISIEDKNKESLNIKDEVLTLKVERDDIDKKKEKISLEPRIESEIEKSKNNIKDYNKQIDEYNLTKEKIENNKIINSEIKLLNIDFEELEEKISDKNEEKLEKVTKLKLYDKQIKDLNSDIEENKRQKAEDEILTNYMKCIHRNGIPTYILKKGIKIINLEFNRLMENVDFITFFDDDLNLKMSPKSRVEISQNGIESSGFERTVISMCLKLALRKINNKSNSNILLLDEVMSKISENNIEVFNVLLYEIKKQINKIFIIEHNHVINYDYLFSIDKDDDGISKITIED